MALRTCFASRAVSWRSARSRVQDSRAARVTSSRSTALVGWWSSSHSWILASSSAGSSCGQDGIDGLGAQAVLEGVEPDFGLAVVGLGPAAFLGVGAVGLDLGFGGHGNGVRIREGVSIKESASWEIEFHDSGGDEGI